MVFIFCDDGGVRVVDSAEAAVAQCEGWDVVSGEYQFFDELGRALLPVFDRVPRERRFLKIFGSVDSGRYHLEPFAISHPTNGEPLWRLLLEAVYLDPNPHYATLPDLIADLRRRGLSVDPPTGEG